MPDETVEKAVRDLRSAISRFDEAAGSERGGYPREFEVRDCAERLLSRVSALEAKLAAAREALRPFARVGEQIAKFIETTGEDPPVDSASADFLRARAFIIGKEEG